MRKTLMIVLMAVLGLWPQVTLAWNNTGHMLVALVAYRQLDDAQKKEIAEILAHHPHYESFLIERTPEGVSKEEWAFLRAATWPDYVRPAYPGRPQKPPSITKYHQ